MVKNWIVNQFTTCNFTVHTLNDAWWAWNVGQIKILSTRKATRGAKYDTFGDPDCMSIFETLKKKKEKKVFKMKPAIALQKKFSINQIKCPVFVANKNQQAKNVMHAISG